MSLTSALSAANSGLRATARMVETTSTNVSNAMTPGYANRSVDVASDVLNGHASGVRVVGVQRAADFAATAARRAAEAENANIGTQARATDRIATAVGQPGETGALANRIASLEAALVAASNEPGTQTYLANGIARAQDVVLEFNRVAADVRGIREEADSQISNEVDRVNTALQEIHRLNKDIMARHDNFSEVTALEDLRQTQIDIVNEAIPVRIIKRPHNAIALFTSEGGTLIDGNPRELSFTKSPTIAPDMTFASGALSGLTVSGEPVVSGSAVGRFNGGTIGALFDVRDEIAVNVGADLDGLARALVERFQDPTVDTTLAAGDPGLFTDAGAFFDPVNLTGLSERISLNSAADPYAGGEVWRLRDGMNAVAEGEAGNNLIVGAMKAAMQATQPAPAGLSISGDRSISGFAAEFTSMTAFQGAFDAERSTYASSQFAVLRESESARTGVDTDKEMADLLLIEQAYAANARVLIVIDQMMQRLMEI